VLMLHRYRFAVDKWGYELLGGLVEEGRSRRRRPSVRPRRRAAGRHQRRPRRRTSHRHLKSSDCEQATASPPATTTSSSWRSKIYPAAPPHDASAPTAPTSESMLFST
jgi:hypothetical protein